MSVKDTWYAGFSVNKTFRPQYGLPQLYKKEHVSKRAMTLCTMCKNAQVHTCRKSSLVRQTAVKVTEEK